MNISNLKMAQFVKLFMICGLACTLTSAIACLIFGMIFIIPILPFVCIPCWIIGSIIGCTITNSVNMLAIKSYLASIIVFTIVSYVLIYFIFCSDFLKSLFWTIIASFVFSATDYPITLYINKKLNDPKFIVSLFRTTPNT